MRDGQVVYKDCLVDRLRKYYSSMVGREISDMPTEPREITDKVLEVSI